MNLIFLKKILKHHFFSKMKEKIFLNALNLESRFLKQAGVAETGVHCRKNYYTATVGNHGQSPLSSRHKPTRPTCFFVMC